MQKVNLTDQELNEWVFLNIFKVSIKELEDACEFNKLFHVFAKMQIPDYCQDLNRTHLMEKKIREMVKWDKFCENLLKVVNGVISGDLILGKHFMEIVDASARQRCEAAYLTFKESK